ncbi:sensor histidine kinase [Tautonia plasticadhaerens]|uniref:histidine kinase n=1 Tax=Tautonia plasticadhaerens TaxID=2527974 RepID=A0A518H4Q9_9BACT|nr:ATP-binding protein [Tautonia plasticadhaerens]QDV35824.1 Sensor kinase CusS [Tautonia plasticadhaerens]
MSLATRLSAFLLAALGVVLLVFSCSIYVAARAYLDRQLDERLEAALDTLEASVDIEPGGLEWEPDERRITLGVDPGIEQVRWAVLDGRGRPVDRSENAGPDAFPPPGSAPAFSGGHEDSSVFLVGDGWRMAGRRLRLEELLRSGRGHPEDDLPDDDVEYARLVLIAGLSPSPARATLGGLGLCLGGMSAATWLACAALGRVLARRALRPIARMVRSARALDPSDPGWSLHRPGTGDELDELASAFNDLLGRLREAFERQRRFAGDASHQLRTPLSGMLGQLDVALRRDRSAEEYRRVLGVVRDEAARLGRIVEVLLFLARSDHDATSPGARPVDLGSWLPDHLGGRWADHPRAADLRVGPAPGPIPPVLANPELLAQCVDNLVDNALKYSEPGSEVRLELGREGGAVTLSVVDLGCGLEPGEESRIFEPFYRSELARRRGKPGVGLGLAVARRIAGRLGGTLEASGAPGRGSRFLLRLPGSRPSTTPERGGMPAEVPGALP